MSEGFITTFTGRSVCAAQLRHADVCVEDIAHALALTNRFRGGTRFFPISVAQHAVYVARIVGEGFKKTALHHDDHEAYTGDCPAPLKALPQFRWLRMIEKHNQTIINEVFGVEHIALPVPAEVNEADMIMRAFEAQFCHWNIRKTINTTLDGHQRALIGDWEPWPWERAEAEYLSMAASLP